MKESLKPGITTTRRFDVDDAKTIGFMGDALRVYATPSMLLDIEITCLEWIMEHLDEGEETVGARVAVAHMGATPLGTWVEVSAKIVEIDRRRIVLVVEVHDPIELVGKALHTRFVIDRDKQAERVQAKRDKLAEGGGG